MDANGVVLKSPFRMATVDDVEAVLPLATETVPGFVEHLWSRLAEKDESPQDFGRRAQTAFIQAGNTIVADISRTVAAMLICHPMADEPNPHVSGMDEVLLPLMALFQRAAGSWYVHGIATAPEFHGQGLRSRLMSIFEDLGRAVGKSSISLLVIDQNTSAIAFYEKRGYSATGSEPVIRKGWKTQAKNWILMEKTLVA